MFDLSEMKPEHFESLLGQALPIVDSPLAFTVGSVVRLKSPSPRGAPFSLSLKAPAHAQGGQGIYRLRHPELGEIEIFLVPIAPVDGVPMFEAVFN
ncbi:MAG: hypothetical protein R3F08_16065 [Dokdonella sp.]|nr:hypothetical protein [Xanthomonadales bacterium]MCB1573905.1 hypothetical protein [Xanthomonadales bacterium]MCB1575857.1 hypothetical protein [Xanthomonadales bacterium]